MNKLIYGFFIAFIACTSMPNSKEINKHPLLNTFYSTPSDTPQLTLESSHIDRDFAINLDHTRILYTMQSLKFKKSVIVEILKEGDQWSIPAIVPFSGTFRDLEPFFHPDQSKLYFASDRPKNKGEDPADFNIWYVEYADGLYGDLFLLDTTINKPGNEFYPSVASNGNIYFTAQRADGVGGEDIYFSKWENGVYLDSQPLDPVSSSGYEFNAFIAPDESFLICSGYNKPDDLGGGDLYIYHNNNGAWDNGTHLTGRVNSPFLDYSPFVDIGNNVLYFSSERMSSFFTDNTKMNYREWIGALSGSQNGCSNIYKVKLNLDRK